jgi:hypothetical protein
VQSSRVGLSLEMGSKKSRKLDVNVSTEAQSAVW